MKDTAGPGARRRSGVRPHIGSALEPTQPSWPTLCSLRLDAAWLASRIKESPNLLDLTDGMPASSASSPAGPDRFAVILFDSTDVIHEPLASRGAEVLPRPEF